MQLDVIIHCFIRVFTTYRLNRFIESIIKETYYYKNKDEIARISELTNWLMTELESNDYFSEKVDKMKDVLFELFKRNIVNKKTIHFDSVIKFQMKSFHNYLTNMVGLAIDEFKREEEYQNFIHSIREYINHRKPKHDEIHIVQSE